MKYSCPACGAEQKDVRYVQRVVEYHTVEEFDGEGHADLSVLDTVFVDYSFTPFIECTKCNGVFPVPGNPPLDVFSQC